MSNVRIYTNDGKPSGLTIVQGTEVFVGDTKLEGVSAVELVAQVDGAWMLKLTIYVDPNALFALLPKVE